MSTEEFIIERVDHGEDCWLVSGNGMAVHVPRTSSVTPAVGMSMIIFSDGPGTWVRGIMINGITVYYLTREEVAICQNRARLN